MDTGAKYLMELFELRKEAAKEPLIRAAAKSVGWVRKNPIKTYLAAHVGAAPIGYAVGQGKGPRSVEEQKELMLSPGVIKALKALLPGVGGYALGRGARTESAARTDPRLRKLYNIMDESADEEDRRYEESQTQMQKDLAEAGRGGFFGRPMTMGAAKKGHSRRTRDMKEAINRKYRRDIVEV